LGDSRDFPLPENEQERLEALDQYDILDTPPEDAFNRLTRLASQMLDTPIALVSLIDEDRQWWKSCLGVDRRQTDRELAFCNFPVVTKQRTVIPDATQDERVKDNSLVTGDMHIRAYAGAPLLTEDNHVLGTLCVIDTEPHDFDEQDLDLLDDLAAEVISQLELRRTRSQLRKQSQELDMLENAMASTSEGITVSNPSLDDNPLVYVNDAFVEMTGYPRSEALGSNCRFLQGEDTDPEKVAELREAIQNEEPITTRILNYRKDGTPFWNRLSVTPVVNKEGDVTHYVGIQQDITERKELEESLEYRAKFDQMTDLLNRETLMNRFSDEVERMERYGHDLSFVLLDLDRFKNINDTHGHQTGDRVLQEVGRTIKDHIRTSDIPGRYGGEEFAVVLPETDRSRARTFSERLRQRIEQLTVEAPDGTEVSVTTSIGISDIETADHEPKRIVEQADQALYQAKGNGRNQVMVFQT
jgi:diguanylate cyclase (GGDEF)-like protein/PAS domain S-box-containing protein